MIFLDCLTLIALSRIRAEPVALRLAEVAAPASAADMSAQLAVPVAPPS